MRVERRADMPDLGSARLRFRAEAPEDAEALFPTLSDAECMKWWSRAPVQSLAEMREYLAQGASSPGWRAWYFAPLEGGPALGWVSVGERRNGTIEIGYILAREQHGRGLGYEAVARVLDYLFRVERRRRVFADTDPDNQPSRRLLERLGFTLEGQLRAEWETHIGVRDSVIYGLLRDEWLRAPVHQAVA